MVTFFQSDDDRPAIDRQRAAPAPTRLTEGPLAANAMTIAPCEARRDGWPRNVAGFCLVSGLLHLAVLAAVAHREDGHAHRRRVQLRSGVASVALAASVASPSRAATEFVRLSQSFHAAPTIPSRRVDDVAPGRPSAAFASARIDVAVPALLAVARRADADAAAVDAVPPDEPPKRSARSRITPAAVVRTDESVASTPAAESAGVGAAQPPAAVVQVEPRYPRESLAAGEQGVVKIWFRAADDGRVLDAGVYRSSGFPRLDAAALEAAHRWRFEPATRGKARASVFVEPFTFRLSQR